MAISCKRKERERRPVRQKSKNYTSANLANPAYHVLRLFIPYLHTSCIILLGTRRMITILRRGSKWTSKSRKFYRKNGIHAYRCICSKGLGNGCTMCVHVYNAPYLCMYICTKDGSCWMDHNGWITIDHDGRWIISHESMEELDDGHCSTLDSFCVCAHHTSVHIGLAKDR